MNAKMCSMQSATRYLEISYESYEINVMKAVTATVLVVYIEYY